MIYINNLSVNNHIIKDEIENAIKILNINSEDFKEVNKTKYLYIIDKVIDTFVVVNDNSHDLHLAWDHLKEPTLAMPLYNHFKYKHLSFIKDEKVWFIAEDTSNNFLVYDVNPKFISLVLDECSYFEYYIISKEFKWLVCENHHEVVFALGDIISKMKELK